MNDREWELFWQRQDALRHGGPDATIESESEESDETARLADAERLEGVAQLEEEPVAVPEAAPCAEAPLAAAARSLVNRNSGRSNRCGACEACRAPDCGMCKELASPPGASAAPSPELTRAARAVGVSRQAQIRRRRSAKEGVHSACLPQRGCVCAVYAGASATTSARLAGHDGSGGAVRRRLREHVQAVDRHVYCLPTRRRAAAGSGPRPPLP